MSLATSRPRRSLALIAGVAVSATLLAACGSSSSGKKSGGSTGGSAAVAGASGVLNIGMPDGATEKNNNNPFLQTSAAAHLGYRYMIYEPLAMSNPVKPTDPPQPWLATKFDWTDNFQTLTLTVRDGVKFSDGTPMTADDVAYSFQILKDHKELNSNAIPVDSVAVQGTNQVVVKFTSSQYVRQQIVLNTFVIPKHIWSTIADPGTDTVANPVGTGPYTLKSFTPQTVTLDVRAGYWQTPPKVAELRYTTYSSNDTQTTALVTGATEWSYVFIPDGKTLFAGKDPHYKLWFPPNLSADGLWINTTIKPFDNKYLRQAMSLVINRPDIFNQGEAGYFKPEIDNITGLPSPAGDPFIISQYQGKNAAGDAAAAKALLTANGFTYSGTDLVDPTGKKVAITLTDPAAWGDYQTDLAIIADNLSSIGIKATVDKADQDAWFNNIANGNFQAAMHWSSGGSTPYDMYENIMDGALLEPIGQAANSGNYGRFDNKDATQALNDYANAPDDATRQAALAKLEQIFVDQVPMIPTSAGNVGAEYSTKKWVGWPDDSNPYTGGQPTIPSALDVVLHLSPAPAGS